ncbi:DUF6090 family protein [Winogradskyella sp.]|uniref:DUF6090 family protein n=1 Tax=Winogradskyella sp. TaxID=1883156 RepID=UPI001B1ADC72|nr:DUF6090 family protein [Winogradskyella sp.]MBO6881048.1 hypothetical protein [Winogradskyella sp.]
MSENKTGKYLKYAIGEIILVVIGILIALQINNWNEDRKVKKLETQIYKELKSDLVQTKNDIEKVISEHKKILKSTQQLIFDISNKKSYSDSIYRLFADAGDDFRIIPKTSAFENLKNIGLSTISNDTLRISISNLFQLDLKRLGDELGVQNTSFNITQQLYPYQMKYLFLDTNEPTNYGFKHSDTIKVYKLKIKNYDTFLTDNNLLKTLQLSLWNRSLVVNEEAEILETVKNVIDGIENEIKQ